MNKLFSSIYRAVFIIILLFLFNLTSPHSIFALDIELSGVEKQYLIDHPVLRIANEMDWPPYDFVENAKPAGYSIELITLIAKQLGIELEFVNGYSWTELMSLFEKGKIDIMPAIYFSEDREKFMSFTDPYSEQPTVMVTGNLSNINTLTDIKNNRVALISEFVITNTLLDKFPELHVVEVKSVLEGLTAVSAGTADVFFESIGAVSYILEHNYIPNLAVKSNPSLDQFKAPALHMAVQKENLILLGLLEKTFNGIPANELKIIKDHWMPSSNIIRSEKQSGALLNILYLFGVIFLGIAGIGIVLMLSMKRLNIGPKIWIAFSSISIFAVAIIGTNAYMSVKNTLEEESYSKLTTIREIKSIQIENYTNILRDQVCTFSENLMIIEAMKTFKKTFQVIDEELGIDSRNSQDISENLNLYYSNEFIPRLNLNLDSDVSKKMYIPKQLKTQIIQNLYITENPNSIGQKQLLNDAGDGSHYSKAHSLYHPVIRSFLEKFGYYDIFLVDSETGHIVYSVFKEVDYGTSLLSGPYQSTNIAKAFNLSNESTTPDYVKLIDFENYPPSYNAHASFISSPIFDGDRKIGVLIFQMPNDRINDIMTSNQDWYRVGLGASGETYILGSDLKMRNQSRFLTEDRKNYLKAISKIGTPDSIIDCIDRLNTSVGLQEVKTLGAGKALLGETGTQIFPDYRNIDVLSSYKPLNIKDVNWVIMSEIDASEAFSHVIEFRN
ncbi:transporter substrate-binding domain-containing protein, partial [bacterium]|nr:transporter substrate-binding domain-containing protein [bacterium]